MNIFIVPLKFGNLTLLKKLSETISSLMKYNAIIQKINTDIEYTFSVERGQYYSTKIIEHFTALTGNLNGKILLITEADLYVPVLTFIFGEAQLNGKHCIVSVRRLHEEFYTEKSDELLLFERIVKESLHELGHNFGLLHCRDWECVMHSSNSIEEVDIKGDFYCKDCFSKINTAK